MGAPTHSSQKSKKKPVPKKPKIVATKKAPAPIKVPESKEAMLKRTFLNVVWSEFNKSPYTDEPVICEIADPHEFYASQGGRERDSVKYDITKTDSITTPYQAWVSWHYLRRESPHYPTVEEARQHQDELKQAEGYTYTTFYGWDPDKSTWVEVNDKTELDH